MTMTLTQLENELFSKWKRHREGFVSDGVADETAYLASEKKILFVLKEVNDPEGGDWDLRAFVREGGRAGTWNNVARWVEGIRRIDEDISWAQLNNNNDERRLKFLPSIGAMNLKKTPGGHTTVVAELVRISSEDRAFINQQFQLYDADLVVCCGVSDAFHGLIDLESEPRWQETHRGVRFHEHRPGKLIVAYSHPEARCSNALLYYGLVDAIREILRRPARH